ncbi:MAG: S8 family serine peptidase [Alphaproteobacteria bacterium]|nr:S8 family serine peptidase [Alphaproteobacteria bacterium]
MIKKYLFSIFFLTFSSSLFYAHCNVRHKPEHIFERPSRGQKVINPKRTTGIDKLHSLGYLGRNVKIAFIDSEIHPEAIAEFKNNIHPSVFQNKFILTPEEGLEFLNVDTLKADQIRALNDFNALPYDVRMQQGKKAEEELNKLSLTIERKEYFDQINNYTERDFESSILLHGVSTLRLLHLIAPQSQLFPFDLKAPTSRDTNFDPFVTFVNEAIKNKVDVINLCCVPGTHHQDFTNAIKEAIQKGIAVIFSAGNASSKASPIFTDKSRLPDGTFTKSASQQILEVTQGKGLLYAGSLGYSFPKGEEVYSDFSQHPTSQALKHHILAPGESICLKRLRNWQGSYSGTSVSAPILAGSFALLKDYTQKKGLNYNRDDLLALLQQSGHNLRHKIPGVTVTDTYKVLNMSNALALVDKALTKQKPSTTQPKVSTKKQRNTLPAKTINKKRSVFHSRKKEVVNKKVVLKRKQVKKTKKLKVRAVKNRNIAPKKRSLKVAKKRKIINGKPRVAATKRIERKRKKRNTKRINFKRSRKR